VTGGHIPWYTGPMRSIIATLGLVTLAGCGPDHREGQPRQNSARASHAGEVEPPAAAGMRAAFEAVGERLPPLAQIVPRRPHVIGFRIRSHDAIPTWERLRSLTERTGYYPLVLRDEHGMFAAEDGPAAADAEEYLQAAAKISPKQWFSKKEQEESEDPECAPPRGKVPGVEGQANYVVPFDILSGKAVDDLWMVLLPTRHGFEVPAHMAFGDWNACPAPEEHVAILRCWHERYGAEIVTMSHDVIELRASRPPAGEEEAVRLAFEQCWYCRDIVDQGVGTIDALAQILREGQIWYFWWD
jgi:hypothetical protein